MNDMARHIQYLNFEIYLIISTNNGKACHKVYGSVMARFLN